MHISGRVAEVVGGGDWDAQWRARVGEPLGITSITWNAANGSTNYGIAGMASSNLRDYGRVLRMLASGGWADGVRLLHPSTIATMRANRVGDLPVAYAPPTTALTGVGYGLGGWIVPSRPDTQLPLMHSLGAFGFFPFVDFERGLFGAFMIRGQNSVHSRALPVYLEMLDAVFAQFDDDDFDPIEPFVGITEETVSNRRRWRCRCRDSADERARRRRSRHAGDAAYRDQAGERPGRAIDRRGEHARHGVPAKLSSLHARGECQPDRVDPSSGGPRSLGENSV